MGTLWNEKDRADVLARLDNLQPELHPKWGRMTCPQMVAHMIESLRMTLGDLDVQGKRTPFRWPVVKQLAIYVVPFPKGAPTAPELLRQTPSDWPEKISETKELIKRFASSGDRNDWPDHPLFGHMSKRDWGVLAQRHFDHHLRQFGV